MKKCLPLVAAAALLAVGACGKKEEPKPPVPQRPPVNQEESKKIPVPLPPAPVPGPTVPKVDAGAVGGPQLAARAPLAVDDARVPAAHG